VSRIPALLPYDGTIRLSHPRAPSIVVVDLKLKEVPALIESLSNAGPGVLEHLGLADAAVEEKDLPTYLLPPLSAMVSSEAWISSVSVGPAGSSPARHERPLHRQSLRRQRELSDSGIANPPSNAEAPENRCRPFVASNTRCHYRHRSHSNSLLSMICTGMQKRRRVCRVIERIGQFNVIGCRHFPELLTNSTAFNISTT